MCERRQISKTKQSIALNMDLNTFWLAVPVDSIFNKVFP